MNPNATDEQLVNVGRWVTIMLGAFVVVISMSIPYLGGAEKLIVSITSLFVGPMVMPTLWALFVSRVTKMHAYLTVVVTAVAGFLLQFVFVKVEWVAANMGVMNQAVGIFVPLAMLLLVDRLMKRQTLTTASA
ncbi:hypothetical protein JCM19237_4990 [Photobacterium aphoticum]|uniref:Sodium-solute symporter n=1 Tax=Photobacterium aphoticum TaxID=754436 RepID=A0A090R376_9GAMM|nr:hypothetical protein JCM19237_4990 [Photobacterium aphoticum]